MGDNRSTSRTLPGGAVDLASQFFALSHGLKRVVNARYRTAGLSMARLQVLHHLDDAGTTRIGGLSEHLDVAARTMTSTIDGMVRDGLVERRSDPADGRAVLVAMTARGRAAYAEAVEVRNAMFDEVFAALDDEERAAFARVLARLADSAGLQAMMPGDSRPDCA
jgi:DNA-binding MarR family transcriptional regulator